MTNWYPAKKIFKIKDQEKHLPFTEANKNY